VLYVAGALLLSRLLSSPERVEGKAKHQPVECGVEPIGDARMLTMSMDATSKGISAKSHITFDDERAATRMLNAYGDVQGDLVELLDKEIGEEDNSDKKKEEMRYVRKMLPEVFALIKANQRGNTLSYEITEEDMDKLMEKIQDMVEQFSKRDKDALEA